MAVRNFNSLRKWLIGTSVLLVIALPFVYSAIIVPLSAFEQAQVSLAMIAFGIVARLFRTMRPIIIFLSCFASMRYFYWRISSTINVSSEPDAIVSILLLAAEVYGLLILFLGYAQTIEASRRESPSISNVPTVDVFIATYNEPVDIVRRTVIGAMLIDYPRKEVYVLDDGNRPEIKAMAQGLHCGYLSRTDNTHAKAGNLNHALERTNGEFIATFDADHVPVQSFLRKTIGFFEDARVAVVQTAQHFYNPDPFERNLNLTGKIAPEQHFFYHVIQPGNDFWNSALFCGSSAVLRRSALIEIGGFKTSTVTEDAHTSLELHSRGYRSVYLPEALAAGLATETYAAHVKQRTRWARGMAQILRTDCPLFKKGLTVPQRLNYFNAMLHFFFGIPRLLMVIAPLTFLLFGIHPIKADVLAVIAYILPHIGLSTIANSIISRNYRHSFWAGVYEISIAPYTSLVTLMALWKPGAGKFNVTDKGANVDQARFDIATASGTLVLVGLSLLALMIGFPMRLLAFGLTASDPAELNSILINSLWAVANLVMLVAALCVGIEQPQQRLAPRVKRGFPCELTVEGEHISGTTVDLSESGIRVMLNDAIAAPAECSIVIEGDEGVRVKLAARRIWCDWTKSGSVEAAFAFEDVDGAAYHALVQIIFTGELSWSGQSYQSDRVLQSLWHLSTTLWRATRPRRKQLRQAPEITGEWRATYNGSECECYSVSAVGATIRLKDDFTALSPLRGRFRLELNSLGFVEAPASLSPIPAEGNLDTLEFHWKQFSSMRAFSALCAKAQVAKGAPKKPFWGTWVEDLR